MRIKWVEKVIQSISNNSNPKGINVDNNKTITMILMMTLILIDIMGKIKVNLTITEIRMRGQ